MEWVSLWVQIPECPEQWLIESNLTLYQQVSLYYDIFKIIYVSIYSFNKYLLRTHYVSSMILGIKNTENKKDKILFS